MRQRFGFILGVTLCAAAGLAPQAARAQEPTAAGLWEKLGDAGKPEGWFRIAQCEGQFEGKIVKIFPKPGGEDPQQWRCTECEGKQKNAPVLGLTFIKGMRRNGLAYENGTILDPRDGSVYRASMRLSPDGKTLTVRGYLGIPLLGQNEVWRRLPDNTPVPPFSGACAQAGLGPARILALRHGRPVSAGYAFSPPKRRSRTS
jgi:uncharacterized protein (DUF2147 family)